MTTKKKARPQKSTDRSKDRTRQREVCLKLLDQWLPVASEASDKGLRAGAFVLKVLEQLKGLDGLDLPEDKAQEPVDFEELARRVGAVSPVLMARLKAKEGGGVE